MSVQDVSLSKNLLSQGDIIRSIALIPKLEIMDRVDELEVFIGVRVHSSIEYILGDFYLVQNIIIS